MFSRPARGIAHDRSVPAHPPLPPVRSPATPTASSCSCRCCACRTSSSTSTSRTPPTRRRTSWPRSPFGQIPVIEDGDVTLYDSNAILVYLATRYDPSGRWLPREPEAAARVQQWLSVAAGYLAYGPAAARLVKVFGARLDHDRAREIAGRLFAVLDRHLDGRKFLTGDEPTIADVAIYTYTALAPEGGVSLGPYGNDRRLARPHRGAARFRGAAAKPRADGSLTWRAPSIPANGWCRNAPACASGSRRSDAGSSATSCRTSTASCSRSCPTCWSAASMREAGPGPRSSPAGRASCARPIRARSRIEARPAAGDPLAAGLVVGAPVGLLGIELETRRRNRMNGTVIALGRDGFTVEVGRASATARNTSRRASPRSPTEPTPRPRLLRTERARLSPPMRRR